MRYSFFVISFFTKKLLGPSLFAALNVGSLRFPNCSYMAGGTSSLGCCRSEGSSSGPLLLMIRIAVFVCSVIATSYLVVPKSLGVTPLSFITWFSRSVILFSIDEDYGVRETLGTCGRVSQTCSITEATSPNGRLELIAVMIRHSVGGRRPTQMVRRNYSGIMLFANAFRCLKNFDEVRYQISSFPSSSWICWCCDDLSL